MKHSELIHHLRQLKQVVPRPEWAASSRDVVLREIQRQVSPAPLPPLARWAPRAAGRVWESLRRLARQPVLALGAALLLALATGLTVNAAFYSLPGEPLYRMKLAFERTQLALVSDAAQKTELKVEFVKNRVKEIEKLVAEQPAAPESRKQVKQVVSRFTREVASVRQDLTKSFADQRTVFQIAVSVDQAGSELAAKLKPATLNPTTPTQREIRQAVSEAVAAAEATSFSALDVAMSRPTGVPSSLPLPTADVQQYLQEKAERLLVQVKQLPGDNADDQAVERALTAMLEQAVALVKQGEFTRAVTALTTVRAQLDALPMSDATPRPASSPDASPAPRPSPRVLGPAPGPAPAAFPDQTPAPAAAVAPEGAAAPAESNATRETTQDFLP